MKTINDLVEHLNNYGIFGRFYIDRPSTSSWFIYKEVKTDNDGLDEQDGLLVVFEKDYPYWRIHRDFGYVDNEIQKEITDFIYTTDSKNWFDDEIIEVDGIKLTREQAEKVYQKLTAERTYDIK